MNCSKCGTELDNLKDGYDGQPTCTLCMAVAKSRPGYEGAALMNAAFRKEQGRPFAKEASMAKVYATESANRACYNALQMLGGYGYTQDFPIERFARDVLDFLGDGPG